VVQDELMGKINEYYALAKAHFGKDIGKHKEVTVVQYIFIQLYRQLNRINERLDKLEMRNLDFELETHKLFDKSEHTTHEILDKLNKNIQIISDRAVRHRTDIDANRKDIEELKKKVK